MRIVLAASQRLLARQSAEDEEPGTRVDNRREAALDGCSGQSTKRPRRTAVWPLTSRRDGMIRTQLS